MSEVDIMNTNMMSYQAMLVSGQRQSHEQFAKHNAKRVQNMHTQTELQKAFTKEPSEKTIKDTPTHMNLFHPSVREQWSRHILNDTL